MRICYVKQAQNVDEYINYTSKISLQVIKKVVKYFKKFFNIITVKPLGDGVIFYVPYKERKEIKLADKIAKKLQYYNIDNIVIENSLHTSNFKNRLYENNVNILNGRWLFNYLLTDVLKYIVTLRNEKLEKQEISILVNDLDEVAINNIYELSQKVKRLNIITNNIDRLKRIENKLYEENGIMVTVANNKRKSLVKAPIIINFDFPEELLNKYNINKKAILINIEEKIKIMNKSFNGININYYDIKIKDEIMKKFIENNMYETFDKTKLYESTLYSKNEYKFIREKIMKDEIEVAGLIGNNGMISEKELKNSNYIVTKM